MMELIPLILDQKFIRCDRFTTEDNLVVIDNTTDAFIEVVTFPYPPYLVYTERQVDNNSVIHFQFCGPVFTLVKELTKLLRVNLKVLEKIGLADIDKVTTRYMKGGGQALPHICLLPIDAAQGEYLMERIGGYVTEEELWSPSTFVGYKDSCRIIAWTIKHEWSVDSQFQCYEDSVYYAIAGSLTAMALVLSVSHRSISSFFTYFWTYLSCLLSNYYTKHMSKHILDRVLSAVWLITCPVLLSAFSGQLYYLLTRAQPIDAIESWTDLYSKPQWNHLWINTFKYQNFYHFIETQQQKSPMADHFKERLNQVYDPFDFLDKRKEFNSDIDLDSVIKGLIAYSADDIFLQYFEWQFTQMSYSKDIDYHVSQTGNGLQPYFLLSNNANFNTTMKMKFDFIIRQMQVNGVYEHELMKFRLWFGVPSESKTTDFKDISVRHMKPTLYVYSWANVLSMFALIGELFAKSANNRNINGKIISYQ